MCERVGGTEGEAVEREKKKKCGNLLICLKGVLIQSLCLSRGFSSWMCVMRACVEGKLPLAVHRFGGQKAGLGWGWGDIFNNLVLWGPRHGFIFKLEDSLWLWLLTGLYFLNWWGHSSANPASSPTPSVSLSSFLFTPWAEALRSIFLSSIYLTKASLKQHSQNK